MDKFYSFFMVGFVGGTFITEWFTKLFPKAGSIFVGLLLGLMYYEMNKSQKDGKSK